jgi:hypothetical protein
MNIFNVSNPSGSTKPWVYSASNINEYQKQKNNVSGKKSAEGAQG